MAEGSTLAANMRSAFWLVFLCACGSPAASNGPSAGGSGGNAGASVGGTGGAAPLATGGTNTAGTSSAGRGNEAGASGSAGSGGSISMLTLKQPIDRGDGKLVLELGSTYFEIKPARGARISSLRQNARELLMLEGASNYADAVGSTFWPSPQIWTWPPPAEIDNEEYSAVVDASGVITTQGKPNQDTGLRVAKKFSADLRREAIVVEYTMTNTGSAPASWAPWEVTRVPASGLAFWPTGGSAWGRPDVMVNEVAQGHTWCDPSKTDGEGKLFADGAGGYLAYLQGDRLLIKQFQDQPASAAAPDEAEIELYVNPDHTYVEVENQGAYTSIAPGQAVTYKVTWFVRQLPSGVSASLGSADLVAFVAETLK